MEILKEIVIAVLTAYLAFTNFLAAGVQWLFEGPPDAEQPAVVLENESDRGNGLATLPSRIGRAIPDILLRSAEYQQAAVSTAGIDGSTTIEPLDAIVNIYCTFTTEEYIRTTTGTGFFIDPDGIIITNAHVAQFFLFEETDTFGDANCVVRTGNPAAPRYHAELLYLSPAWIQGNAGVINDERPSGTGERDYALLYVSSSIDNTPLPARFPALGFETDDLPISTKGGLVTAAGYPATPFLENGPSADLIPVKASTTISELYTFGSNRADVFSIRGSVVGVEGASGGPVVNSNGNVVGVIVTRGNDVSDGQGSLRAITLSHIERTIKEETGFTLNANLGGNLPYRASLFKKTLTPFLIAILEQQQ